MPGTSKGKFLVERILFFLAFFGAYTLQAITGFAGNLFAMPAGVATIGMGASVVVLNICGCLACGMVAIANWKDVNKRDLVKVCITMFVFMAIGIYLDTLLSVDILMKIFGVFVLLVGVKNLIFPSRKQMPEWVLWLLLAGAGLIQGMFVSGGALLVVYALQKYQRKAEFRATLSAVWMILNFIYAAYMFATGHATGEMAMIVAVCIPLLIVATALGSFISRHISQKVFLKFSYVILIGIGLVILFLK